ncbi:response regulator [Spirochaeta isovalerica]|uniref:CheY-like chemotaxis protein n=1 Tax=Spirochaeta isovalerica TaxID=150 RepID=A0A841R9G8_9SPIO|nr:response regulator [Spirochaeta isovalerica]MBB6480543.1 CheY-like chemotaxis protein [Spirochaeta isovalerica]
MAANILIVDDSEFARKVLIKSLNSYLKDKEVEIRQAGNGKEALSVLKKRIPDLMFLDLTMPEMDGYELLDELEKEGMHFPIVVISADIQSEAVRKVKDRGVLDFMRKPVSAENLNSLMEELKII